MLRAYSELRQEIAARERTEKSLRASEAGYRRVADEQAALRRVATLVARGARPSEVFAAATDEVGHVLSTEVTWLIRYLPGPAAVSIAAFAAGERPPPPPRRARPLGGHNIATLVHKTARPARVQGSDWLLHDGKGQVLPITSGIGVPVVVAGSLWGVMAVASSTETPLPPDTEARLAAFTELIAMAIANAEAHEAGLGPALRALARRSRAPVGLDVRIEDRLPERVEVTAYYIVSEALTNAAKHANATAVHVDVDATHSAVRLAVRDDGVGGADPASGSGLLGLYDRVEAVGGTITIHSPIGEGTELLAELPLQPVPAPD